MYKLNKDYFKNIDNQSKAYFLGLLYADGCICEKFKNGKLKQMWMEITLKESDIEILKYFLKELESDVQLKLKKTLLNGKEFYSYRLTINCTELCRDLIKLGVTPRKSLTLTFPNDNVIPEHLRSHFVRGYFDGDGCISYGEIPNRIPSRDGKYYYRCGFIGTDSFIESLFDILEVFGLNRIKKSSAGKSAQVMWGGRNNAIKLYNYMYNDATVYIKRKYDIFKQFI